MNAPLPATHPTPSAPAMHIDAVAADDPLVLTEIFADAVQLVEWRRPPQATIGAWLASHAGHLGSGLRQILRPGDPVDLSRLPAGPGRDALAADLGLLAEMLGELVAAESIGLRLEVVRQAMCPRLHVDRVGIRMLCTYRGAGTEWVAERDVDRRFLGAGAAGQPDTDSGLLRPGYRIEQIPAFAVALLKGSLWQGNAGRGAVHRSPAVTEAPRILAALDAGW